LIATPFRKPTRIGLDRKSAKAPRRKKLATMQMSPVKNVNVIESDKYRSALPGRPLSSTRMMLFGSCEPQLNERAVKLLLRDAIALSALGSVLFYRATPW